MPEESREELIAELVRLGVKHTPEDILAIRRDTTGRVVFLEQGGKGEKPAGYSHVLEKSVSFENAGYAEGELVELLITAATQGKVVRMQRTRSIFEIVWKGKLRHLAIEISSNGFIVGANPSSVPK